MTLQVAPCTACKKAVVYGERRCRHCGQTFDYGANPVPIPSIDDMREALIAAGVMARPAPQPPHSGPLIRPAVPSRAPMDPVSVPSGAPVVDEAPSSLIERTSHAEVGAVRTEDIPDFVSSELFAPYTPKNVDVELVAGLESSGNNAASIPVMRDPLTETMLDTGRFDVESTTPVMTEEIPGFIDSTLFKAYTPDTVETERIEGLELSWHAKDKPKTTTTVDDGRQPCLECGTPYDAGSCPACGARRRSE